MTIKELYDWASLHKCENAKLYKNSTSVMNEGDGYMCNVSDKEEVTDMLLLNRDSLMLI